MWGTPALRALKKSFPGLVLHLVVNARWRSLFHGNPHVDRIIPYHPQWYRQPAPGFNLLPYRYDAVLIFHANRDITRLLPWLRYKSLWAHQNSSWIPEENKVPIEGVVHGIQRRLTLIEKLGARPDGGAMEIYFDDGERGAGEAFLRKNRLASREFIYINVGASAPHRKWPESRFLELAQILLRKTDHRIVLGGGAAEKKVILEMLKDLDPNRCAHSLDLPLKTDTHVIGQARLLITCDTGPMHIGFALKVPTAALFGPYDPRGTGPFQLEENRCIMIHPSSGGIFSPRADYHQADLEQISVSQVWEKVREVLAV